MRTRYKLLVFGVFALAGGLSVLCPAAYGQRKLAVGENMPEFSARGLAGQTFEYKHGGEKVLMVVFLAAKKKHTASATADIEKILRELPKEAPNLDVVFVVDDPNISYFKSNQARAAKMLHIVGDAGFKLWGKFGVIATPTVFIADGDNKVVWTKAGYGYAFASSVRTHLNQALGLAEQGDPNRPQRVKTLTNDTVAARVKRYLRMAKMLEEKGQIEFAIAQMGKARELDPNSAEVVLNLGELYCRTGQGNKALDAIGSFEASNLRDRAQILTISGWARRLEGEFDAAEKLLLQAATLDARSTRALFELGKVYQAKEQPNKALNAYYRALALIFGEKTHTPGSPRK